MSGSATFTIVMSSSSMKTPVQTATRVHHFGSRGGCQRMVVLSARIDVNRQVPNDYVRYDTPTQPLVKTHDGGG